MTSTRDGRGTDHHPRATDSAACLLVVGGYEEYADILRRVVAGVRQRFLLAPTLGDFFEVRFGDLGPRPNRPGRGTAEVARLVLELTSRPGDAARNFSAVLVFDQSAAVVDHLLQACARDPALNRLNARCLGMASRDDRSRASASRPTQPGDDIAVARQGRRNVDEFVTDIYRLATRLLNDFGSGWKPGIRPEEVSRLGSEVEPHARGTIERATADEDALFAERRTGREEADSRAAAERREQAAREAAAWDRELAAQRQIAELEREVAELRRDRDLAASRPDGDEQAPAVRAPDTAPDAPRDQRSQRLPDALPNLGDPLVESGPTGAPPEYTVNEAPLGRSASRWQRLRDAARREVSSRVRTPEAIDAAKTGNAVDLLGECVERLKAGDLKGAGERLSVLRSYASTEIDPADRERYRAVLIEDRLLSPQLPLGTLADEFHDVLLQLVYGQPVDYQQYCDLEYCLERAGEGALPPAESLMRAIYGAYLTDHLVLAITRYYLGRYREDEKVRPRPGDTRRLIIALAEVPLARGHVDILFEILAGYLGHVRTSSERREIRDLLRECGYLSAALSRSCPDAMPAQVDKLMALLRWAYPEGLDRTAADAVVGAGTASSALLAAILHTLTRPTDRPWAIRTFVRRYRGRDISLNQAAELEPEIMQLSLDSGHAAREITDGSLSVSFPRRATLGRECWWRLRAPSGPGPSRRGRGASEESGDPRASLRRAR